MTARRIAVWLLFRAADVAGFISNLLTRWAFYVDRDPIFCGRYCSNCNRLTISADGDRCGVCGVPR